MRFRTTRFIGTICLLALILAGGAGAQAPRPLPAPIVPPPEFTRAIDRGTRSATGEPGPRYWQQYAWYQIRSRLDVPARRLEGTVRIRYFNRSPDTLGTLALHLHQNIHAAGVTRNEPQEVTGGVELTSVMVGHRPLGPGTGREPSYQVDGTILRLRPPAPVLPGDSVDLSITWGFKVPQSGAGRMGWSRDDMFFLAYWYPQMAVYDDVVGWHTDPYLGSAEFYAGFADYDVEIDVPDGWIVIATGRLQNEAAVLAEGVRNRLRLAERSDTVVPVVSVESWHGPVTAQGAAGRLTWRYTAERVRDVSFSATRNGLWDAVRTPVGDRDGDGHADYAVVNALYRADAPVWRNAARFGQHAIAALSRFTGLPYPWPHMSAVEGAGIIGGGMEFPMMTLIGNYNGRPDSALYYVIAHEFAHMWVPMIVGTDERRYGWMDEGTTTFNENQVRKEFYPGRNPDLEDRDAYTRAARSGYESEMMRWTDYLYPGQSGIASYSKPATVLAALRAMLGDSVFFQAYHTYLKRWAFRHPKPWDLFNTFNHVTGKALDWFWRSWYYETWTLDQAVAAVEPGPRGTRIVVEDRGLVPMPARVTVTLANGQTTLEEVAVEHWLSGERRAAITVPAGRTVRSVEIDAAGAFPDVDRSNNRWPREVPEARRER